VGILGKALQDYSTEGFSEPLMVLCDRAKPEPMRIEQFFDAEALMPPLDRYALSLCKGHTLDLGAGAGRHSLALMASGLPSTALESDPFCATLVASRGVKNVLCTSWEDYSATTHGEGKYDTVLALMNGIGLAGTMAALPHYLEALKQWLAPGGQVLIDSSDVHYLPRSPDKARLVQEVLFAFQYQGVKSEWFSWIFVEETRLKAEFKKHGWKTETVFSAPGERFLLRATES
jgi:hypothetical protein